MGGTNVSFAATGITGGEFFEGVRFTGDGAFTHSVMMRSKTGSVRYMTAYHNLEKLEGFQVRRVRLRRLGLSRIQAPRALETASTRLSTTGTPSSLQLVAVM